MKLKVCGMKNVENIKSIGDLKPDYMGFIFYERSKRNFEGIIPELPKSIKKTGVFVNEYIEIIVSLVEEYKLEAIQLHGDESVEYVQQLKEGLRQAELDSVSHKKALRQAQNDIEIIKVFGIKDDFDFGVLKPYENEVDYFLFDTKGKERGGNGTKFDWSVLKKYSYSKPFFLGGGIGPNDAKEIKRIQNSGLPIYAVDINSKFENNPGLKNNKEVKNFRNQL
ncbi:MAG: phosphoribosylanthranilate isomerase [Flavobacteriaceae bacterium]|nr:phosphoribosylanthranilate isomerase [Flavobacteriaceae bacterium]